MAETTNGLVCFTNCLLPQEDGSLIEKDLWFDERRGVIVDAQVIVPRIEAHVLYRLTTNLEHFAENFFRAETEARHCDRPSRQHP